MTATAPHSRLYAVGRLVLLVAAIALTVWGISLVAFSNSMRDTRVGIPIAFWGVLAGYAAIRMGNARAAAPPGDDGSSEAATGDGAAGEAAAGEVEVRASAEIVRERDEAARREYEIRLELMLRRELEQGLREELAALRRDVAELRGDVLDAVDGRLRMERVEITRIIGSNLAALHDDGRISLTPAADVTVPAPVSDELGRARDADVGRETPSTWTGTTMSADATAGPAAQRLPRTRPDATAPGGWFDLPHDRPVSSAPTPAGSGEATQSAGSSVDPGPEPEPAVVIDEPPAATVEPELTEPGRVDSEQGETEPAEPEPSGAEPAEPEPAQPELTQPGLVDSVPPAAELAPEPVEPEPAEPELVERERVESEVPEPELAEPGLAEPEVLEPAAIEPALAETAPRADPRESAGEETSSPPPVATAESTIKSELRTEAGSNLSARPSEGPPTARPTREDPFANLPRLSSFRLPDLPEGVSIAALPEPPEPEAEPEPEPEPEREAVEPAASRPVGGYVGRRRHAADDDASTGETSTGRHGAGPERAASSASAQGPGRVTASRHRS